MRKIATLFVLFVPCVASAPGRDIPWNRSYTDAERVKMLTGNKDSVPAAIPERPIDQCGCRDLFLSCANGCGSFVLKCEGTGVATYQLNGCARGVNIKEYAKDGKHLYYREPDSDIRWAFSRSCCKKGHEVWISHRENPLSCEWRFFGYASDCKPEKPEPCNRCSAVIDRFERDRQFGIGVWSTGPTPQ